MNRDGTAIAMHQREFRVLYLPRARRAAHLPHAFEHMKQAAAQPRMAGRQQAAMRGHRQFAAQCDAPVLHERAALAFFTETQIFQLDNHRDGKTIIKLGHVDIGGRNPRHRKRFFSRFDRAAHRQVKNLALSQSG